MSLEPIEYQPWDGSRSSYRTRPRVMADRVLRGNLGSGWYIGVVVIGTFLVYGLNMLFLTFSPLEYLDGDFMLSVMANGLSYLFILLLVTMLCSDLLAEDARSRSHILYFSRAVGRGSYLLGKGAGAALSLSVFALVAPVALGLVAIATQTSDDWMASMATLGRVVLAGAYATALFVPFGLMMSSLTERRAFAAVGTFMGLFGLDVVSSIFQGIDESWRLISPQEILHLGLGLILGQDLPSEVNAWAFWIVLAGLTLLPLFPLYMRVTRAGVSV